VRFSKRTVSRSQGPRNRGPAADERTASEVENIFATSGSLRRIREMQLAFDTPDRYGKGFDYTGYTVHDSANLLLRYLLQLPVPVVPLEFYDRFRSPVIDYKSAGTSYLETAIRTYQSLITEMPPLHRQLLLYMLDFLAVFASKCDLNKMTTAKLAAIFQPGLLSHPEHRLLPNEQQLSQEVLIFLTENQDSFLIGMPGTATNDETN